MSLSSLNNFLSTLDLKIFKAEKIDTHGGSIRVYVSKDKKCFIDPSVQELLKEEEKFGHKNFNLHRIWQKNCEFKRASDKKYKRDKKNNDIIGYGAPAKATTALNYFNINNNEISFILEDNHLKHTNLYAGVKIPIASKENLKQKKSDSASFGLELLMRLKKIIKI